jgi:hypothetical protein
MEADITGNVSDETATAAAEKALADQSTETQQAAPTTETETAAADNSQAQTTVEQADQ